MKTSLTKKLERTAMGWLISRGCVAYATECHLSTVGGVADAVGVKLDGTTYYLEVKQSKGDLFCGKQKRVANQLNDFPYHHPYDFTYFVLADGLTLTNDQYPEWGIISRYGQVIRRAKRRPIVNKDLVEVWRQMANTCSYRAYTLDGVPTKPAVVYQIPFALDA